jgi:hypothetical protein
MMKEIDLMKKALVLLAAIAMLGHSAKLSAGGTTAPNFTTITAVDVRNDGTFLVYFDRPATGSPACANASSSAMTGNASTNGGKAVLSHAIAMFVAGKKVYMEGTGTCNEYAGYESIIRIYAANN